MYTFKILGKEYKSLKEQLFEALEIEDYKKAQEIKNKIEDEQIKNLLK